MRRNFMDTKAKILVVDDEVNIVNLMTEIFETSTNIESESCTNPLDAKKIVATKKFDLIITDYRMPHITGGELVKYIREKSVVNKETAILFITANPEQTREFVKSYEDILILEKPITLEKLAKNIVNSIIEN